MGNLNITHTLMKFQHVLHVRLCYSCYNNFNVISVRKLPKVHAFILLTRIWCVCVCVFALIYRLVQYSESKSMEMRKFVDYYPVAHKFIGDTSSSSLAQFLCCEWVSEQRVFYILALNYRRSFAQRAQTTAVSCRSRLFGLLMNTNGVLYGGHPVRRLFGA